MVYIVSGGDWTGSLNGLTIGAGSSYNIETIQGWYDAQGLPLGGFTQLAPRQSRHGSWLVPHWMPKREVVLGIAITGASTQAAFAAATQAFRTATLPTGTGTIPLTLQFDGLSLTMNGVMEDRKVPIDFEYQFGMSRASVTLGGLDVRLFGSALTGTTGLPSTVGGLAFPATAPFNFTGTSTSGSVALTNAGNATGPVIVKVYGPLSGAFSIIHAQTGLAVSFGASTVINAGDYLQIDPENRVALYNGLTQATRNNWITNRGWFGFQPGANTFQFNSATYSASASMQVTATPAYI